MCLVPCTLHMEAPWYAQPSNQTPSNTALQHQNQSPSTTTARPAVRWLRSRNPVHQKRPLQCQTTEIDVKPQRTPRRQNDVRYAKEMIRKTPRNTRLSAARLECVRHLLRISPLRVGPKSLRQEVTPNKYIRPATNVYVPRPTLYGRLQTHNYPIMVIVTPRHRCRTCLFPMMSTKNLNNRETIS